MPEVKNIFVGAKMNKDLNPRMISNKEYIDARNAAVINSEDSDSGLLQNVSGNVLLTDFGLTGINLEIIGFYIDTASNRLFTFITDWNDVSGNGLSNFAPAQSHHYICVYDTRNNLGSVLVSGSFLNFEKLHPVLGINLIEDLLFFTDNRNQPRKINVTTALSNPSYYLKEEDVSVAKYYPWKPLRLSKLTGVGDLFPNTKLNITTNIDEGTDNTYPGVIGPTGNFTTSGAGVGGTITVLVSNGLVESVTVSDDISLLGAGFAVGDTITVAKAELGSTENLVITLTRNNLNQDPTMKDVVSKNLPKTEVVEVVSGGTNPFTADKSINGNWVGATITTVNSSGNPVITVANNVKITDISGDQITVSGASIDADSVVTIGANPYYDATFEGDIDYLTDRFIRFSYRFKYNDNEYSLMAPFSQAAFIPRQDGYFLEDSIPWDVFDSAGSNSDELKAIQSTIISFFENKVNSAELVISMPEGVSTVSDLNPYLKVKEIDILYKESDSNAIKIIETIATADLQFNNNSEYLYQYTSQIPIRTLPSNETTRVSDKVPIRAKAQELSGNRVMYGNYLVRTSRPSNLPFSVFAGEKPKAGQFDSISEIEYPSHSLKQNRSYKIGIILVDKFGRQSDVINSPLSTVYNPYLSKSPTFLTSTEVYRGDSLKIQFNGLIPSQIGNPGYAGLYSEENPTGWYSYKVVVQQKEQDYYNVYLPPVLNNYPGTAESLTIIQQAADYSPGQYNGYPLQGGQTDPDGTPYSNGWDVSGSAAAAGVGLQMQVIINGNGTVQSVTMTNTGNGRYGPGTQVTIKPSVIGGTQDLVVSVATVPRSKDVAFLTLFSDNINKIPRDLKEVGPDDRQFSSSVEIYPRIDCSITDFFRATSQQFDTSPTPDKVVLIGTRDEIGVNLDTQGDDYNSSPFYSIPKPQITAQPNITPPIIGELNLGGNPYIGKLSTQRAVGSTGGAGVVTSDVTYRSAKLNVYETVPVESSIDIFYETGSGGLISELNQSILSNVGSDFPAQIVDWTWGLNESQSPGDFISAAFFDVVNSAGTSLTSKWPGNVSIEILEAWTIAPTTATRIEIDITNDPLFEIVTDPTPPNRFKLRTTPGTYFSYTKGSATFDEFRFVFRCTVNRSSVQKPNEVNDIAIGFDGYNNRLTNSYPTIVESATTPVSDTVHVPAPNPIWDQTPNTLNNWYSLYNFDSRNGTSDPNIAKAKEGMSWVIPDVVGALQFFWSGDPNTPGGSWQDYNNGFMNFDGTSPIRNQIRLLQNSYGVYENVEYSGSVTPLNPAGTIWPIYDPSAPPSANVTGGTVKTDTRFRFKVIVMDTGGAGYGTGQGGLNVAGTPYPLQTIYIEFIMKIA